MTVYTIEHHPDQEGRGWRLVHELDAARGYAEFVFGKWEVAKMPKAGGKQDAGTLALIDNQGRCVKWCGGRPPEVLHGFDDLVDLREASDERKAAFPRDQARG